MERYPDKPESDFLRYNTALFRKVAPYYDAFDLVIGRVRRDFAGFVAPAGGARILDVATGTGRQAFAFAGQGCSVVGVDLSEDMLAVARSKNRFSDLVFARGDAAELPFKDESFDVTCMSFALHCMPPAIRCRAVRELKRVTRRGGTVSFVDYGLPTNRIAKRMAFGLIGLFETDYWREFVLSDFEALLRREGLTLEKNRRFFSGCMRMFLCLRPGGQGQHN